MEQKGAIREQGDTAQSQVLSSGWGYFEFKSMVVVLRMKVTILVL